MPVLVILAGLAALALYGWLCYAVVVFVVAPVWPWALTVGAVAGALVVAVMLAAALLGAGAIGASTVTPAQARTRLPKVSSPRGRDGAWANYLFAQARDDLRAAAEATKRVVATVWGKTVAPFTTTPQLLALWPVLLIPAIALASATAAVVVAGVVVYGVIGLALGLCWLLWLATAGALRGVDAGVRTVRRAKATCHRSGCTHRSTLPGYRCPCSVVHFDIRAGRQGLFTRRCECGRAMPTTVLQAAAGLTAVCRMCERDLHAGSAVVTDVSLPVFGPASAGKTRLVMAGIVALGRHLAASGGTMRAAGPDSEAVLYEAERTIRTGARTTKTDAGAPPAALSVRLTAGRRRALLHLFDAAGEFYADREQSSSLQFLDDVEGLVFVLDPFSVAAVASGLRGPLAQRLTDADPARQGPADAYRVTALWMRDAGTDLKKIPLAVAVVKADLLLGLPPAAGLDADSDSATVRAWLQAQSLEDLVDEMERDFGPVSYHLVSSQDVGTDARGAAGPLSPARPLLDLLFRSGMTVAAAPEPAVAP